MTSIDAHPECHFRRESRYSKRHTGVPLALVLLTSSFIQEFSRWLQKKHPPPVLEARVVAARKPPPRPKRQCSLQPMPARAVLQLPPRAKRTRRAPAWLRGRISTTLPRCRSGSGSARTSSISSVADSTASTFKIGSGPSRRCRGKLVRNAIAALRCGPHFTKRRFCPSYC
jgi:hypothetical protein